MWCDSVIKSATSNNFRTKCDNKEAESNGTF